MFETSNTSASIPFKLLECQYSTIAFEEAEQIRDKDLNFLQDLHDIIPLSNLLINGNKAIYILVFRIDGKSEVSLYYHPNTQESKAVLNELTESSWNFPEHHPNSLFEQKVYKMQELTAKVLNLTFKWTGMVNRWTVVPFVQPSHKTLVRVVTSLIHQHQKRFYPDVPEKVLKKWNTMDEILEEITSKKLSCTENQILSFNNDQFTCE